MGDDHWRFSIMSVSRPGDCSIAGPSCSACRAFPRGFVFNAVPEEEKLLATTPRRPGSSRSPGALSDRERGLLRRSPTRGHLPLWLVSPMQATPAFRGPSPTAGCATARSRAGPPLGGAFWDGGAETLRSQMGCCRPDLGALQRKVTDRIDADQTACPGRPREAGGFGACS